jgi:hypothetical protein
MKACLSLLISSGLLFSSACSDANREAKRAKEETDAKARAEAAKKEMNTLPKTFSTPDYYKKNEPAKSQPATPTTSGSEKK